MADITLSASSLHTDAADDNSVQHDKTKHIGSTSRRLDKHSRKNVDVMYHPTKSCDVVFHRGSNSDPIDEFNVDNDDVVKVVLETDCNDKIALTPPEYASEEEDHVNYAFGMLIFILVFV